MPPARILFYFLTLGGIALAAVSLLHGPPPLWISLSLLFAYVGFVSGGVVLSRFSMFGDVVTSGPADARGVALTFDDGPDPKTTPKVLDLLDEAGAKATFFVIGHKAERHPEVLRDIAARGHLIGVHSYSHDRTYSLRSPWYVKADLERSLAVVRDITGQCTRLFRAPIGHVSPSVAKVSRELDLELVGWTVRGVDGWAGAAPEKVAKNVARRLRDGSIVLLHDAAERGDFSPASIEALPLILEEARRRNLVFVAVDAWLEPAAASAPGTARAGFRDDETESSS